MDLRFPLESRDLRFPLESRALGALCTCSWTCVGTGKSGALETQIPVAYEAHLWLEIGSWISVRVTAEGGTAGAAVLADCFLSCILQSQVNLVSCSSLLGPVSVKVSVHLRPLLVVM